MSRAAGVSVMLGRWDEVSAQAAPIRFRVFVDEQGVPVEMELDEFDALSCHALAWVEGEPVGTGRLLPDGHIGRMAVLAGWRGRGVGAALLEALMAEAGRLGMSRRWRADTGTTAQFWLCAGGECIRRGGPAAPGDGESLSVNGPASAWGRITVTVQGWFDQGWPAGLSRWRPARAGPA